MTNNLPLWPGVAAEVKKRKEAEAAKAKEKAANSHALPATSPSRSTADKPHQDASSSSPAAPTSSVTPVARSSKNDEQSVQVTAKATAPTAKTDAPVAKKRQANSSPVVKEGMPLYPPRPQPAPSVELADTTPELVHPPRSTSPIPPSPSTMYSLPGTGAPANSHVAQPSQNAPISPYSTPAQYSVPAESIAPSPPSGYTTPPNQPSLHASEESETESVGQRVGREAKRLSGRMLSATGRLIQRAGEKWQHPHSSEQTPSRHPHSYNGQPSPSGGPYPPVEGTATPQQYNAPTYTGYAKPPASSTSYPTPPPGGYGGKIYGSNPDERSPHYPQLPPQP